MSKKEITILVGIVAIALTCVVFQLYKPTETKMIIVRDTNQDEVILRFDLNKDAYYEFDVPGGKFHIEVKDGRYRAIDVDCPNQTCVKMGWMPSMNYYAPIICVPNGIVIVPRAQLQFHLGHK